MLSGRQKIWLVNREFQLRYTWGMVGIAAVTTILTAFIILFPLYLFEIIYSPKFLPAPFLGAIGIALFLNMLIIAATGILATHRVAGPLFRLTREMKKLSEGSLEGSDLNFRLKDELKFVARSYNDLIHGLRSRTEQDLQQLNEIVSSLDEAQSSDQPTDQKALLQSAHRQILRFESELKNRLYGAPS